jgi:RNA polymerase sigma-70 factor (ECF subfamily)
MTAAEPYPARPPRGDTALGRGRLRSLGSRGRAFPDTRSAPHAGDGDLIVRCANGDERAFEELYARYARAVFGLALNRLRDRGRAEDVVQEVFASIWRSAPSYRPERGAGAAWLYTVARNAIIDRWRTRSEPPAVAPDTASLEPGPEDRSEQAWRSFRVHRALETLPESERTPIELAYWGGLSQSEIADRLRLPLGTVKTRTRSGLARLGVALEEDLR